MDLEDLLFDCDNNSESDNQETDTGVSVLSKTKPSTELKHINHILVSSWGYHDNPPEYKNLSLGKDGSLRINEFFNKIPILEVRSEKMNLILFFSLAYKNNRDEDKGYGVIFELDEFIKKQGECTESLEPVKTFNGTEVLKYLFRLDCIKVIVNFLKSKGISFEKDEIENLKDLDNISPEVIRDILSGTMDDKKVDNLIPSDTLYGLNNKIPSKIDVNVSSPNYENKLSDNSTYGLIREVIKEHPEYIKNLRPLDQKVEFQRKVLKLNPSLLDNIYLLDYQTILEFIKQNKDKKEILEKLADRIYNNLQLPYSRKFMNQGTEELDDYIPPAVLKIGTNPKLMNQDEIDKIKLSMLLVHPDLYRLCQDPTPHEQDMIVNVLKMKNNMDDNSEMNPKYTGEIIELAKFIKEKGLKRSDYLNAEITKQLEKVRIIKDKIQK